MKRYEYLIFISGAVTLSLEVLASRIMTPYFGVSLYIWSGILSITLAFLAIGYRLGGILSAKLSHKATEDAFLATPIVSALAMLFSALTYPFLFPLLSQVNLVIGSFIGATLLLALPLIVLSAMNPLLISLQHRRQKTGDGGAGRVFFISTMGSVAGVLITAFLFIPNITNFRGVLLLCLIISGVALILIAFSKTLSTRHKRFLLAAALASAALSGLLSAKKTAYLNFVGMAYASDKSYEIQAEYTSMFGNIKVVNVAQKDGNNPVQKYFIQDGLVQNRTTPDNTSISMYTHVLEALVRAYVPETKEVLVLGLGAGILPRNFQAEGKRVSVVEINPTALEAATENFGFDGSRMQMHIEDARTFVRKCEQTYDAAVVDLFLGDNTPDYLMTREFFTALRRCIKPQGAMVMNAFLDSRNDVPNKRLMSTVASAFTNVYMAGVREGNAFIVGTSVAAPATIPTDDEKLPIEVKSLVKFALSKNQLVPPSYIQYVKPVTDEQNIFSILFADANMEERQYLAGNLPPHILVN